MTQGTLFDPGDDTSDAPKHGLKCPPWLAARIAKASGGKVSEAAALKMGQRQAFAVLGSYQKAAPPARAKPVLAEPVALPEELDPFVRAELARELPLAVAEFEAGRVGADELYRFARGALYALTAAELPGVVRAIADTLKEPTHGRAGTGSTGAGDAAATGCGEPAGD